MGKSLIRGLIKETNCRFSLVNSKEIINESILQKDTDPISSYFLAHSLNAAITNIPLLNEKESLSIQWRYPDNIELITVNI